MIERTTNRSSHRRAGAMLARVAAALGFALALGNGGCRREASRARPLVLVGVDGLEWDLLLRFAAEAKESAGGGLPNLMALAHEGLAAKLDTLDPTLSPVIWTTIVTGKRLEKHGIKGFSYFDPPPPGAPSGAPEGEAHLFTSVHRKSKAFWNVLSDAGQRSGVFGWWCTFPAEEIEGEMVAQTSTRAQIDFGEGGRIWKGNYLAGLPKQTWPEELAGRMDARARALADEAGGDADPFRKCFGSPAHPLSPLHETLWASVRSAFYADVLFERAALDFLDEKRPYDALLVYFGVTDVASHLFWRHLEPERYDHPPTQDELADFGHVIRDAYRSVDAAIGELRRRAPDADFLVISDHGFGGVNFHETFPADGPRHESGHHMNSPAGVLIAAGPGFRRSPLRDGATKEELKSVGRVEELLPTLLVRAGLPYGEDMDGRPMRGLLSEELLRERPIRSVESHEDAAWRRARQDALAHWPEFERRFESALRSMDDAQLKQLMKLGYVGPGLNDPPPPPPPPPKKDDEQPKKDGK
jgi:hypothetical protein